MQGLCRFQVLSRYSLIRVYVESRQSLSRDQVEGESQLSLGKISVQSRKSLGSVQAEYMQRQILGTVQEQFRFRVQEEFRYSLVRGQLQILSRDWIESRQSQGRNQVAYSQGLGRIYAQILPGIYLDSTWRFSLSIVQVESRQRLGRVLIQSTQCLG